MSDARQPVVRLTVDAVQVAAAIRAAYIAASKPRGNA